MERQMSKDEAIEKDEMWSSDPILVLHFGLGSCFEKFIGEICRIMVKYINKDPYNSVTSLVRFYEEFKKQHSDLMNFYETVYEPTIQEDSQNCVGKALYLRRKVLKHAGNEYQNLESYIYFGTGNPYFSNDIPTRYHNELPQKTACLKAHACLVLKFTLESQRRRGFIILDPGFLIDFPVVVMEDGRPPNTGRFQLKVNMRGKCFDFKYFNDNYVYWQVENFDDTKCPNLRIDHRWFFVGEKLQNHLQIEKRNRLFDYHALVFADFGGPVVSFFTILGAKDHIEMTVQEGNLMSNTNEDRKFVTYKIPFPYFLPEGSPRNADWENALKMFDEKFQRYGDIYQLLQRLAVLATDVEFVKELSIMNDSWNTIIKNSFN